MAKQMALSKALIRENFKLHWYIPVIGAILYFFSCIFNIATCFNEAGMNNVATLAQNSMEMKNVGVWMLMVFMPLFTSCIMMGYYHKREAAFSLHSQPYSRARLFNSQIAAGWLMMLIPVLVTALLYLLYMSKVVFYVNGLGETVYDLSGHYEIVAAYGAKDVLLWFVRNMVYITFYYGLYTLAGSIVGNTAMQILGSGVFFTAIPTFMFLMGAYLDEFMPGYYTLPSWLETVFEWSNPVLILLGFGPDYFQSHVSDIFVYLILGLVFLVLAHIATGKAKLENVGDGMIFKTIEELSCWLVGVIAALTSGLFFSAIIETRAGAIVGAIIGAVLSFYVVKIITHRTIKVFTKHNLKSCGILVLISIVLASCLMFDLTGFAKRTPKLEDVEAVYAQNMFVGYNGALQNAQFENELQNDDEMLLKDPESIEKVLALHNYIIESGKYYSSFDAEDVSYSYAYDENGNIDFENQDVSETVYLEYRLKNGKVFERNFRYHVDDTSLKLANDILTCDEYREFMKISDKLKNLDNPAAKLEFTVYLDYSETGDPRASSYIEVGVDNKDIDALIDAYQEDVMSDSYYLAKTVNEFERRDVFGYEDANLLYSELHLTYDTKDNYRGSNYLGFDTSYTHLMSKLDELGYFDHSRITASGGSETLDRWFE